MILNLIFIFKSFFYHNLLVFTVLDFDFDRS